MKERPILFSAPMVRAILSGKKTQTRRVVKPVGSDEGFVIIEYGNGGWPYRSDDGDSTMHAIKRGGKLYLEETPHACPFGQPGDRLWVREAWAASSIYDATPPSKICDHLPRPFERPPCGIAYPASGGCIGLKLRPSIHMPRWASRITLEVTGVHVQQLQDISTEDALAEGVNVHPDFHGKPASSIYSPLQAFRDLWEVINGPESWDENPWVFVIEFQRVLS